MAISMKAEHRRHLASLRRNGLGIGHQYRGTVVSGRPKKETPPDRSAEFRRGVFSNRDAEASYCKEWNDAANCRTQTRYPEGRRDDGLAKVSV
ncbi:hypothetical protein ACF1BQ_033055 [Bradyrhizobium sp. RDT10]